MANNFDSNFSRKLAKIILGGFESSRVHSKYVNTQLLSNAFDASTGENVDFKRPHDYKSSRTADGDVSGGTAQSIISGKATGTVQDYITVEMDYTEADQAIKMAQKNEITEVPAAKRIATDLEVSFASFMAKNVNLLAGDVGTAADTWDDIAEAGAAMQSAGVPMDADWCYTVNPYTQRKLASTNRGLGAGGEAGKDVSDAVRRAMISQNFAGMMVMTATSLPSYTTGTGADRAGTLSAAPDATYVTAKDSMRQTLAVTAFQANLVVAAGETITIAGCNRINLDTKLPVLDETGANVLFSGTVAETVTLNGSGAGNIVISGPAIYEANGAYNTVDSAPANGAVVTLGGAASTLIQPNLFWHKNAFAIGSVPMEKLYSTDTIATTADGLQIRVSRGVSIRENKQIVRLDLRPAFACLNPFYAGKGFGAA